MEKLSLAKASKEVFDRKRMPEKEHKSETTDLTNMKNTKHLNQKESTVTVPGPKTNFLPGNAEGKRLLGGGS